MRHGKRKREDNEFNLKKSIINATTPFQVYEAYKSARTALMAVTGEDGCKVIAVTSGLPGEGKTVSTINLAITMMQSGKRVLIIDADMRASKVGKYLKIPGVSGLSEYLRGEPCKLVHHKCDYPKGEIDVFTAGAVPGNPAELLMNKRMGKLLKQLKDRYDYIFIDTPPLNIVTDATALRSWVSGYLLVVRAGKSNLEEVRSIVEELGKIDANILGFFVHDINVAKVGYARKYRYIKYGTYDQYHASQNYIINQEFRDNN